MSDELQETGVHDCGHATEAHSDANGCELCECGESLGRDFMGGGGQVVVIDAPVAEGGAEGV